MESVCDGADNGLPSFIQTSKFQDRIFSETTILTTTIILTQRISTRKGNIGFVQENRVDDSNLAIDHEWLVSKRVTLEFGVSGVGYKIHYKTALTVSLVMNEMTKETSEVYIQLQKSNFPMLLKLPLASDQIIMKLMKSGTMSRDWA